MRGHALIRPVSRMDGLVNPSLQPIRWTERETAFRSSVTPYLRKEVREHRAALFFACTQALFLLPHLPRPSPVQLTLPFLHPPVHFCHSLLCLSPSRVCHLHPVTWCDAVAVIVSGTVNKRPNSLLGLFLVT